MKKKCRREGLIRSDFIESLKGNMRKSRVSPFDSMEYLDKIMPDGSVVKVRNKRYRG